MIIQFSALIDGVNSKKDKTISIKLGTQELSPEHMAKIFEHQGHQIWVAMAEHELKDTDLEVPEVVEDLEKKTPSQRLRDRMAVYYKETKGNFEGFNEWYKTAIDKIGQGYLNKLN